MRTFEEIEEDFRLACDINDALALMRYAVELDGIGTPLAEAASNRSRGESLFRRGDHAAALFHFQRALARYEDLGDRSGVAEVTASIGIALTGTGDFPGSLEHLHRAMAIFDELGDRRGMARAMNGIGGVCRNTGDYLEALEHFNSALALREELSDLNGVAGTNCNIGIIYIRTGNFPAAFEHLHRALALSEELGNRRFAANVLDNLGIAYMDIGDFLSALEHYQRALAIHEETGNRSGEAGATGNIGIVQSQLGNHPAALECYHRALTLHEELGERSNAARVRGNIGTVLYRTGDYPSALIHLHHALELHEELGYRSGVARTTGNIGGVHNSMGDYSTALEYFHRALALHEDLGERSGVANSLGNIGSVHHNTGNNSAALEHYRRALALHKDLGEHGGVMRMTGDIIGVYVNMHSDDEARALLQDMDAMHIDEPDVRINRELVRGTLKERGGDHEGAVVTLQNALIEAQVHGLRLIEAEAHSALRDVALAQGNLARYVEHNNEYNRITDMISGKEATLKMAMQAKQREIDAKDREHQKQLAVLHSTLPKHIADRVARGETVNDHFDNAAVIFLDIVGFTALSEQLSSTEVVQLLDTIFTALDNVCMKHDVVKIKTIGDSYMAVAFPLESSSSEQRAASAAIAMLHAISHIVSPASFPKGSPASSPLQVRIGLHSGPVTAGVIGTQRLQYDVWGDTVNVASRMESTSEPGRIHVSSSFALALSLRHQDQRLPELRQGETAVIPSLSEELGTSSPFPVSSSLIPREEIEIKGKGTMQTYWLE